MADNTDPNNSNDGSASGAADSQAIENTLGLNGAPGSSTSTGLLSPFTNWIGQIEADTMNIINQVMNSLWFFGAVATGLLLVAWGLYLLFKDTAPVEGLKTVVGAAAVLA